MAKPVSVASTIAADLADKPAALKATVKRLREVVKAVVPGGRETLNPWSIPTFEANSPFAWFKSASGHVSFGFLLGTSLPDPENLLEGTGKNLRHVKLREPHDVDRPAVIALIEAAVALNRSGAPNMMGRRKSMPAA